MPAATSIRAAASRVGSEAALVANTGWPRWVHRLTEYRPGEASYHPHRSRNPTIRPRAEVQLLHRRAQQTSARLVQLAHLPNLCRPHVGVAQQPFRCSETLPLALAGRLYPRHLDVDADAVQQRAGACPEPAEGTRFW